MIGQEIGREDKLVTFKLWMLQQQFIVQGCVFFSAMSDVKQVCGL